MKQLGTTILTAIMALLFTLSVRADTYIIKGQQYVTANPTESLTAVFTRADGGVTIHSYSGYVLVHVTGGGDAGGSLFNDAFYYTYSGPVNEPNGAYQLTFDTKKLVPSDADRDARNFLVYDVNADKEVTPPYVPAYNSSYDYTFILDSALITSGKLHFGVCDDNYSDNSGEYTITVTQLTLVNTNTVLTCPDLAAGQGSAVIFSATLQSTQGIALSNEPIVFRLDRSDLGLAFTGVDGTALFPYQLPATLALGTHTLTAAFEGDIYNTAAKVNATLTVLAPTSLIVANRSGTVNGTVTLSARLLSNGVGLDGKTLAFSVFGVSAGTAVTDTTGTASVHFTIPDTISAGARPILVTFASDATDGPAANLGTLTVAKSSAQLTVANKTGTAGKSITLTSLLRAHGHPIVNRTVTFFIDDTSVGKAVSNSSGQANLVYTLPTTLSQGAHSLTADFKGDGAYMSATSNTATLTVH